MAYEFFPCPFNKDVNTRLSMKNGFISTAGCKPNTSDCKKCGWNPAVRELRNEFAKDKNNWSIKYVFDKYGKIVGEYKTLNSKGVSIE